MRSLALFIPGDLDTRTGGYGYDRRIVDGLRSRGWSIAVGQLADTFPFPASEARKHAAQMLAGLPDDSLVMIDGLALGALPDEAEYEARRLRLVGLVHHPLAAETGLEPLVAAALYVSERRALAAVRHVIVTSRGTAAALSEYGVESGRVTVVEPGTDRAAIARAYRSSAAWDGRPITLLCVASLTPRKDHETLLGALATLADRPWCLRCAGADRDAQTVQRLRARLAETALAHRVTLLGDLNEAQVAEEYDRADVFVLATRYEGYGMAVAEALARGLPVISTPTGAIADLLNGQAGILIPPGDARALAAALASLIDDEALRLRLAGGARAVRAALPTWDDAADRMSAALSRIGKARPRRKRR